MIGNREFAARFGREPPMTAFVDGKKLDDLTVEELRAAVMRLLAERDAAWAREAERTRVL